MAFASCEALSTVTISSSSQLESIGPSAFELCSFTNITLPATLRSIGDGAFWVNDDIEVHSFITTPFDPKDAFGYGENNVLYIPAGTRSLYDEFNWWYCFENIIEEGNAVTLTAVNCSRQYGEANPTFGFTVSNGTLTSGSPTITCSATATSPVGTYDIVIAKGTVGNETVNLVNGTLTITKAPLTISAGNYSKVEGEDNPAFTPTFSGFKNGESKDVLTKQPTVTTTATKTSAAGDYPVTVSGAEAQNYNINYENGTLTVTAKPDDVITFADAEVKRICVEKWDTNGDGELSETEAAAVTDLGLSFGENKLITSFNELQFFNHLTSIGMYAFNKCSGLTSLTIPSSVTSIGKYAFSGCSGLTTLTIPSSVTSIESSAFRNCSGLIEIKSLIGQPFTVDAFSGLYDAAILYVPIGTMSDYKATNGWKEFKNIVEMGDANGDGQVDYGDATSTINHIIGQSPAGFDENAADMNNDGKVDIVDVAIIIEKLRQK